MHSYNREWIYCTLDIVHILEQYSYANSLNISIQTSCVIGYQKDNRIMTFCVIEQICSGYRDLCVSGHWTDHRTDCWIQWTNLLSVTVVRSDWFHYCVIVCTIESIPFDCNHYFNCEMN